MDRILKKTVFFSTATLEGGVKYIDVEEESRELFPPNIFHKKEQNITIEYNEHPNTVGAVECRSCGDLITAAQARANNGFCEECLKTGS